MIHLRKIRASDTDTLWQIVITSVVNDGSEVCYCTLLGEGWVVLQRGDKVHIGYISEDRWPLKKGDAMPTLLLHPGEASGYCFQHNIHSICRLQHVPPDCRIRQTDFQTRRMVHSLAQLLHPVTVAIGKQMKDCLDDARCLLDLATWLETTRDPALVEVIAPLMVEWNILSEDEAKDPARVYREIGELAVACRTVANFGRHTPDKDRVAVGCIKQFCTDLSLSARSWQAVTSES